MSGIMQEDVKKVLTKDRTGLENGFLIELFKDKETNDKTEVYLSAALPGAFKGYHLHRVRAARYVCLKGKMKVITYEMENGKWVKSEFLLDSDNPQRLFIPNNIATGLMNVGSEEGWLINYPDPSYDPSLTDEQVEYTEEELLSGIVK